jgi:hypothetical protein
MMVMRNPRARIVPPPPRELPARDVPRHPDVFRPEEAAVYLHLDSVRSLETLERDFGLKSFGGVNRCRMFHRRELDKVVEKMFAIGEEAEGRIGQQAMKMSGGRR